MKFNGTDFKMFKKGTPNSLVKETRSLSLNISVAPIDVTTRDSGGWGEYLGGLRTWGGSVTGIIDYTEGSNETALGTLVEIEIDREAVEFVFGNNTTGNETYTGFAFLTNVELTAEYESTAEFTADLQGTGPIVPAAVA